MNELNKIVQTLNNATWVQALLNKSELFVVGGAVRDSFLRKSIKDIDLICEGLSFKEIKEILTPFGRVSIHGESFSVLVFKPEGHIGEPFEIATPRMDRKIGEGHKGFEIITEGVDLVTDLKRRDFTINSLAKNVRTGELIDPYSGLWDLDNRILRATDVNAFTEDPLRIIRGIQFASRFNFNIDSKTLVLMKLNSYLVKEISNERIFDEFMKIINKKGNTDLAIKLLRETEVDKAILGKSIVANFARTDSNLDAISFFFVLGTMSDVNPREFVMRLKGPTKLANDVFALTFILSVDKENKNEEDWKYILFKVFKNAKAVKKSIVLPHSAAAVVLKMDLNEIPATLDDIKITGDDIMELGKFKEGPEVGFFKEKVIRDALMNRFKWHNREESLKYLDELLKT